MQEKGYNFKKEGGLGFIEMDGPDFAVAVIESITVDFVFQQAPFLVEVVKQQQSLGKKKASKLATL